MKTAFLVLFLFAAGSAFAQYVGSLNSGINPYQPPDHPAHASIHALAEEPLAAPALGGAPQRHASVGLGGRDRRPIR